MRLPSLVVVMLSLATAVAAQDTTGVGAVRGVVRSALSTSAPDVAVCLPEISRCVVTDDRGGFALLDVRQGRYRVEIIGPGQPPLTSEIEVRAGLDATIEVTLPDAQAVQETVTVTAPRFVTAEEVKSSAYLVSSSDILLSAGALQDVSRYVQTLPGVVLGTNDSRNDLIVRGGSPLENLYIVDNVEIPNINTFANFASAGGTVSILDAQLIQDVTFLTGGFPASYGNRTSSVLQTTLREGNRERVSGRATVGFAGAGIVAEGPIASGRGSWIVSGRRSFLDLVTDDIGFGGVPVQYTVNGKVVFDLNARHRLWLLNVTGIDEVRLGLTEESDPAEELSNVDV
jgi:TonB-dependent Receptor Plug Domain/Carboxypeptidase regulatory-like domain